MANDSTELGAAAVSALRARLRGTAILPGDDNYHVARRVWNGAIDRRPSAVVVCADAEDVALALRMAAEYELPSTIRGGGHNVAGRCIRDGALLLDLSRLTDVWVNTTSRIATAQGGALWRGFDAATARYGLATTGGLVSTTGIGGFTLGGGAGWLMRRHGLACDNLLGANVVLSDGRIIRATPVEHPDMFWALRGGAGGLGVVTSFEFQTHPLREVLAGLIIYPADQALRALQTFRDFADGAPDEFCGLAVIANAPPLPFLDPAWHGRPVVIFAVCWCGERAEGERSLQPLQGAGQPLAEHLGWMPYVQWQQMQDPAAPPGLGYYWKTANFSALTDDTLEVLAGAAHHLPSPRSELHVQHMGGAVARVPRGETAFAHRDARFFINVIGITEHAEGVAGLRERVRALYEQIIPGAMPSIMPNFSDQDDEAGPRQFGSDIAQRLESIRRRYDPNGLLAIR